MDKRIKEHLINYCKKQSIPPNEENFRELLLEEVIFSQNKGTLRWCYVDIFNVVEIDGMLIGYDYFYIAGDDSPADMDLEFDMESICEVVKKQKVIDYYEKKQD